jgi:ferric-dicitrate binding protein FerR (iron transport regulator)
MEKEIRRADPQYRRQAIIKLAILCGAAAIFGTAVIVWGRPWMQDYLTGLEPRQALRLIIWSLSLVWLSFLPLCAFIYLQGRKIILSECYPAPETRVLRDIEVIRGQRAVARGRLLVRFALILAALALVAAVCFPYWLNRLAASQKRFQKPPGHGLLVLRSAVGGQQSV